MTTEDVKLLRRIWAYACRKLQAHQIESANDKIFFPQAQITAIWSGIKRLGLLQDLLSCIKGAMSHTAHVRDEALHLENVHQLFQVLRVIQYQEFIVIYLSHPVTVRRVIRPLLLNSSFRRFHCVFVSITVCTLINGLFEVNCLKVTKCPLIAAAGQELATRKSSPKTQRSFSLGGRLVKGFCWMEQFSHLGFLRGSSADMTTIFFLQHFYC